MERGMTVDQVFRALWRRKVLILAIAAGVFAVGAAVVMTMPSVYKASTVVRVEPQTPSQDIVQRTVSEQVQERMATIHDELLARPVLQKVIEQLGLYPETVQKSGIDAAVEQMRRDLDVKVEGENAFAVTYSGRDPGTAAKVANTLPGVFAEEAAKTRELQAQNASKLFEEELGKLQKSVSEWETKITQFKVAHMGELPEEMEANMRGLERIAANLQTKSEELRAAEARRSDLARSHYAADTEAGRLEAARDALEGELVAARSQWTADHPEVQRLRKELTSMQAKFHDAEARMVAEKQERAHAAEMVTAIQAEIDGLHKQADTYQKRLDNTPRWGQELSVMNRDYDIARQKYQSVLSRKVEAEIAQELEAKAAKSLFNVISPATLPATPAAPDRMGGLLIALLVAMALGVLAGVIRDLRDESIRDVNEAKERLPLPVLAVVPQLGLGKAEKRMLMQMSEQAHTHPNTLN